MGKKLGSKKLSSNGIEFLHLPQNEKGRWGEKENQYSEKKGCRRKWKILKEKVSVLRYPRKGGISEEFHWCTINAPYVIGKSHLPN